jgi:inner membrane protein
VDNLNHSLIGAAIGQTGLKKLSGLGMATLIVAANVPDIDAACFLWLEGAEHLAFRRGITHGPPAMLILPALLTAAMVGFDRWQTRRGTRPDARLQVRPWQLFLLALIGTISHPAADWLNNYGVRLLEPFSSRWFYGDTLFIIDVWLWAILIGGWFWSRRAEKGSGNWMRRGQVAATVAGLYVFANGLITGHAEASARRELAAGPGYEPTLPLLVVASPEPVFFWERRILWRGNGQYGDGRYRLGWGIDRLTDQRALPHFADDRWAWGLRAQADENPQLRAYLFWSRMPVARPSGSPQCFEYVLTDQRYADPLVIDRFTLIVPVQDARSECPPEAQAQ